MAKRKLRLLIIDDDEVNNFVLIRKIKETKLPISCSAIVNGKKAIKKLRDWDRRNDLNYPDIILLDLNMPVLDGFAFLDLYEAELSEKHPEVQLFMVSASERMEDRSRARAYQSVSNFVSKPVSFPILEEIIHQARMNIQSHSIQG